MQELEVGAKVMRPAGNPLKTFLIVLPMLLFSFTLLNRGIKINSDPMQLIPLVVTYVFLNTLFILMVHTGKVDQYRTILFVTYAICFVLSFIPSLVEVRGSNMYTPSEIIQCKIPFCHVVIPMTIIPAILSKTIIFPGSMLQGFAAIGSMLAIWLGASLALGRGFCSWGCFYGGLEDGFSRLPKKPLLKKIDPKWRYFSYAVLLGVVLTSMATLTPTYCAWLCPFKTVTEFAKISSVLILIQTIIFVALFVGLVVILPLLTKKRTQCSFLCPFGALQSFTNKIDAFAIRIDPDKCTKCKLCISTCPTFSVDEASLARGKANLSCTKCGKCVAQCPRQAITLAVKGAAHHCQKNKISLLFLYPAFTLLLTMGGRFMLDALHRIMLLITTGRMIH